jgi:hypothetical protein
MSGALERLDRDRQAVVRGQVRELLGKSEAFQNLAPDDQKRLARSLVDVVAYMADPGAGQAMAAGQAAAVEALAGQQQKAKTGAEKVQDRLAKKPDLVQKDFKATSAREGGAIYKEAANAVNFPAFVAGLIDGVFNSIVTASIRQMEAYGKLLDQVVKSVDDFAKDNFTPNQGRDYLVQRFPSSLKLEHSDGSARVVPTDSGEDSELADVRQALGIKEKIDLSDEGAEIQLAQRAQLEMAKLRQKQLSTMVLMGINRIVVTDGAINAKVMIDVQTTDRAKRGATAAMNDDNNVTREHGSGGGWFSSDYDDTQEAHRTVVSSATTDESESKAELKAKLSGDVRVNFKTETFPLEKLASQTQLDSLNQRAEK